MSGVYILPAILSQIVFSAISGVLGMKQDDVMSFSPSLEIAATDVIQWESLGTICHGASLVAF